MISTFLSKLLNCLTRFLAIILFSCLSSILASIFLSKEEASIIMLTPFPNVSPAITGAFALIELFRISKVNSFISDSLEGCVLSYGCKEPSYKNKILAYAIEFSPERFNCVTCAM